MSAIAISARGIGKTYTIRHNAHRYTTLGEALSHGLRNGFRRTEKETFRALDDVSFEVAHGEVVGIIGRNGAGKSTLLKILSQITSPTCGEVDLHGRVGSLLEVGTGFHPELTGRENIFLNGAILGMGRGEIQKRFDEIVAFAEVEKFLDMPVKRYSSGMYVRLAFAVAAHLRSDILIVDEVLAVGDISFQKKCLGKMGDISREKGTTVLFVSHNMAAVRTLCTRAMLLAGGRVALNGVPDAVISGYLSTISDEVRSAIDLPDFPGSPARRVTLQLMTAGGRPCAQFRLGETWKTRLEFQLDSPLPHVIAAIGLRSTDGVPLITTWSAPSDLGAGRYAVEFTHDMPFSAGEMNFVTGISTHERTVYYHEGFGSVSISEIAIGSQPLRASGCGFLTGLDRPEIQRA